MALGLALRAYRFDAHTTPDAGAAGPGGFAGTRGDLVGFKDVGAVGQVQVVRLGGSQRQHGHVVAVVADVAVVGFSEDPVSHAVLQSVGIDS